MRQTDRQVVSHREREREREERERERERGGGEGVRKTNRVGSDFRIWEEWSGPSVG